MFFVCSARPPRKGPKVAKAQPNNLARPHGSAAYANPRRVALAYELRAVSTIGLASCTQPGSWWISELVMQLAL